MDLNKSELLLKIPFFTDIKDKIDLIAAVLTEKHIDADHYIIKEGEMGDELYLILRGVVRVTKGQGENEQEVATLFAGDFFGEMALLYLTKRTANCKAVTPCTLYVLTRQDLIKLDSAIPEIKAILEREAKKRSR